MLINRNDMHFLNFFLQRLLKVPMIAKMFSSASYCFCVGEGGVFYHRHFKRKIDIVISKGK